MTLWRKGVAGVLSIVLFQTPASGAANSPMGAILSAARAHVGTAPASAGTTVFGGDILSTEQNGNLQIRAGAARLLLAGSSSAMSDRKASSFPLCGVAVTRIRCREASPARRLTSS